MAPVLNPSPGPIEPPFPHAQGGWVVTGDSDTTPTGPRLDLSARKPRPQGIFDRPNLPKEVRLIVAELSRMNKTLQAIEEHLRPDIIVEVAEREPALAGNTPPTVLEILSGYTTENWADVPPVGLTKAFCPQCGKPGPHKRETVQDGETNNQFFLCTECASLNHLEHAIRQFENSVDNLVHCTACAGLVDRTQMVFAYSHSWLVCKPCLDRIVR